MLVEHAVPGVLVVVAGGDDAINSALLSNPDRDALLLDDGGLLDGVERHGGPGDGRCGRQIPLPGDLVLQSVRRLAPGRRGVRFAVVVAVLQLPTEGLLELLEVLAVGLPHRLGQAVFARVARAAARPVGVELALVELELVSLSGAKGHSSCYSLAPHRQRPRGGGLPDPKHRAPVLHAPPRARPELAHALARPVARDRLARLDLLRLQVEGDLGDWLLEDDGDDDDEAEDEGEDGARGVVNLAEGGDVEQAELVALDGLVRKDVLVGVDEGEGDGEDLDCQDGQQRG
mmetsp:Transcript_37569/g.92364  ORF Transcript_37569/g.92364 Transcript_37569/m.92364 type:complete len:288 (+) Transcript_37569:999-1862(+)